MRARFNLAVVLVLLTALPSGVTAQQRPDRTRVWAAFGLGTGASRSAEGVAAMGQLVYQKQPHHIALRGLIMAEPYSSGSDPLGDLALLYGRVSTGRVGHAVIASGLALARGDLCASNVTFGCDATSAIGIPIVLEAAVRPLPVLGLGLQGFVNLNTKATFGGVLLFIQLGWLP